jgi:hypothetical protein
VIRAHFAVAFLWAVAGGTTLVALAPVVASGAFLDPRLLALTHLFTLGWLTTLITGVLYQVFPALLGVNLRSTRVARWSLVAHTAGTALLAAGLLTGRGAVMSLGWSALFAGVFGAAWNLLPARRKAQRNREMGLFVSYAHSCLGLAMALGGARVGDALGWWTTPRLALLGAHFTLAAIGYATMTAFGVGSRLLPTFFGATEAIEWPLPVIRRVLAAGAVAFATGLIGGWRPVEWLGALAMAGATLLFLWLSVRWLASRAPRPMDAGLALLLGALAWLALAVPAGVTAAIDGLTRPGLLLGLIVIVVLGWLSGLILGVSYRILPTLTAFHRFGPQRGRAVPGAMPRMILPGFAWGTFACHSAGITALTVGVVSQQTGPVRVGAALFTLAVLVTLAHHLRMQLVRPAAANAGAVAATGP